LTMTEEMVSMSSYAIVYKDALTNPDVYPHPMIQPNSSREETGDHMITNPAAYSFSYGPSMFGDDDDEMQLIFQDLTEPDMSNSGGLIWSDEYNEWE